MGRFSKLEIDDDKLGKKKPGKEEADLTYDQEHYINLGHQSFYTGEYDSALRLYSRALPLDKTRIDPYLFQIETLIALGQHKEADLWRTNALKVFPNNSDFFALKALAIARTGSIKRAIFNSDSAMVKGVSCYSWLARGEILLLGKNPNAHYCLERAVSFNNDDWHIKYKVANIYIRNKKYTRAIPYLRRCMEAEPTNHYLWYLLAFCYFYLGLYPKMDEALKKALELQPNCKKANDLLIKYKNTPSFFKFLRRILRKS